MSYTESNRMYSIRKCPYSNYEGPNVTKEGYIKLPDNSSELNEYLCHTLDRRGPMCSECIDGFGPSVTSEKFKCTKCTNDWSGPLLYLLVDLVPITLFLILILTFRINITSPPMTCFIVYSQAILFELTYSNSDPQLQYTLSKISNKDERIKTLIMVIYGSMNLEVLHYIVPPFCISSKLQTIHIILLEYISAVYSLCLVVLTWICVELHDRNFKPLVLFWKPFHKCTVRMRNKWHTKNDLIDVFASFFFLSYSKVFYQSLILAGYCRSVAFDEREQLSYNWYKCFDPSSSINDVRQLKVTIPAAISIIVFNILPALLLLLYPIRLFRVCLAKFKLDRMAIKVFIERLHSCCRDGINDGEMDMRSFSALYLFCPFYAMSALFTNITDPRSLYVYYASGLFGTCLLITYFKPYRKKYMNILDIVVLVNAATVCLFLSLSKKSHTAYVITVLMLLPALIVLSLLILTTGFKVGKMFKNVIVKSCRLLQIRQAPSNTNSEAEQEAFYQQLYMPVSVNRSQGTTALYGAT